jgi:hypothetical protein
VSAQGGKAGLKLVKCGIEKHAEFYRGYTIADCSLAPLTIGWAAIVVLWFLVYLVGCIGPLTSLAGGSTAQWSHVASRP